ncbi:MULTISPECIES: GNAT family N-acetyltransferase [Exiguobacterium]|uniref:GNAT family N-acetyltransferase n=1 Tax=Exiguobacterium TaxID=33986 RepID=UPI001BEB6D88|nr:MULTISPECIES: GNAT family N-acetyltransferase [Exiguobacterium]MCT4783627.1 GNAT family N-acetyltransferase [Exiguobacterium himgiriensis]
MKRLELARRIERIKAEGTSAYIRHRKQTPPYEGSELIVENKGHVFRMGNMSFAVGFGLNRPTSFYDLHQMEKWVRGKNVSRLHVEVCPLADMSLIRLLQERNYTLDHFLDVWLLDVEELEAAPVTGVERVDADNVNEWARAVAAGFAETGTILQETVDTAKGFYALPENQAFLVREGETAVAGGILAIQEGMGELFLTSTIPAYRGKGYQTQLILERIAAAKAAGCQYVTVTTKVDTVSGRNMERLGFIPFYQKAVMKSPILK